MDVNEGLKDGAATTLGWIDLVLALDCGASFMGFYPMAEDDRLIDDNFRSFQCALFSGGIAEPLPTPGWEVACCFTRGKTRACS